MESTLTRNTENVRENMNACVPTFRASSTFWLNASFDRWRDYRYGLHPIPRASLAIRAGQASRNISTFRLISLLDSFCFPSDSLFTAWYASLPIVYRLVRRLGKLRCLSVRERAHQPTTNYKPPRYAIQPTATAREQSLHFLQPTRLI